MFGAVSGAACGFAVSFCAVPVDVVKIRLMAEAGAVGESGAFVSGLRAGHAPSYEGTLHALRSLAAEPGGLLRGVVPSVTRGALMAASQLASYDHSKHVGKRHLGLAEGTPLHVG